VNYYSIKEKIYKIIYSPIYKIFFKKVGRNIFIYKPLKIQGFKRIEIGDNVIIQYKTWLAAKPLTGRHCQLIIGEDTAIGNFNHIYATHSIKIGKNVLTADKVYISDNLHSYKDINIPIIKQPIKQINEVIIGDGTWIGENVCIIGAHIGKNCVIGANSVVTKDIPDYSVAVGIPAKVIKQYKPDKDNWIKYEYDY